MSALAWYLEDEGLPTVAISLIRVQSEKVGNPRSLWVPFELGRPLGPADAPAFQKRVIAAALALLSAKPGPVLIADFPEDDPSARDLAGWIPPLALELPDLDFADPRGLEAALIREIAALAPAHERFVEARGRTTVGLSGLDMGDCAAFIAAFLAGPQPESPIAGIPPAQVLRWAVDDLKAYCLEAASAGPDVPSSRQMQQWLWDRTAAARAIVDLRRRLMAGDDARSQAIGRGNLVPSLQVARLGLS